MQLVCCVFARSNPATGQLELHEGRFQSLFPLYFEPETGEGGQVAPRYGISALKSLVKKCGSVCLF
eukprot:m.116853 g.116853  ORF g.116853 m.116853 type:complete len:66 (-) comp14473_c0_seq17:2000-2197(-)